MLVKEIKPIGKVGKNILKNEDANSIIEKIIEKPLQKACKACKEKNIETVMSSANKKNITKKKIYKIDVIKKIKQNKMQTFLEAGKGYAWLMLNYNTLSDENREILFSLEKEFGEETIWFVKSSYIETMNRIRKPLKLKPLTEEFDDKFAEKFEQRQLLMVYNNKYPRRTVFIRMPINENTKVEEVEIFFENIISKLANQN